MQSVLCIDLTSTPARAEVVAVEGRVVRLIERRELDLRELLSFIERETALKSGEEPVVPESEQSLPSEDTSGTPPRAQEGAIQDAPRYDTIENLLQGLTTPWTAAIVIASPPDYISINLELPFSDPTQIGKILPLEVQDRVPFPLDEFLLDYHNVGKVTVEGASSNDIHVSLVTKRYIAAILAHCKGAGIEPLVVTTPQSMLSAALYIAPEYFPKNCGLLIERAGKITLALAHDGIVKHDRMLTLLSSDAATLRVALRQTLIDMRLGIAGFEKRYGCTLEKIYIATTTFTADEVQQVIARPTEQLDLHALVRTPEDTYSRPTGDGLATISAVCIQDIDPAPPLSNFRVHEFSYSPRLTEVFRGARQLAPYLAAFLCIALITLAGVYFTRFRYLSQLKGGIAAEIKTALTGVDLPEGLEVEALRGQLNALEAQLKDLGSLAELSPLETYAELSRDVSEVIKTFPQGRAMTLRAISIKSTGRIKIEGSTTDYRAVDELEKALRQKRYRADGDSKEQVAGSQEREFTIDIVPRESAQ
jgi:hypothetical protein